MIERHSRSRSLLGCTLPERGGIDNTINNVPNAIGAPVERGGYLGGIYPLFADSPAKKRDRVTLPHRLMDLVSNAHVESREVDVASPCMSFLLYFFANLDLILLDL